MEESQQKGLSKDNRCSKNHSSFPVYANPDRIFYSLPSQGGSQVLRLIVAIGIGGWIARYLGPLNLGILSYVGALVGLLGSLGNLGLKVVMRCFAKSGSPGLLGSALLIELIGTFLVALVLIPVALARGDPVVFGLIGLVS